MFIVLHVYYTLGTDSTHFLMTWGKFSGLFFVMFGVSRWHSSHSDLDSVGYCCRSRCN